MGTGHTLLASKSSRDKGKVADHRMNVDPETVKILKRSYVGDGLGGGSEATVVKLVGQ